MAKHTLLLLQTAVDRLGADICQIAPDVQLLVMDDDGNLTLNGIPSAAADITPTLAWMGIDLYRSPQATAFTRCVTQATQMQWVQTALAGVEAPMFKQIMDNGARLSSSDAQAPSIGDFVIGSVIAHVQHYSQRRELQADRKWQALQFRELGRLKWLIVGYGSIGQEVAKRAQGFGATVVGIRRQPQPDSWARVEATDALGGELANADVVVMTCSLTDTTRGMVNADFLTQMKPQSILVNVGRGALVVDADLLAALDNGYVEHAILDVFDPEPLPESHRYWEHPRVLVGSHGSSFGDGMSDRGDLLFLNNLEHFLADQPLHKEVHALT